MSGVAHSRHGCGALAVVAIVMCAACAPPLMKLPSGPGSGPVDASDALREATRSCRDISTIKAEISVTGSVGGHGLRARLLAGLAAPASARLEALAPFGQPVFIFVSRNDDATLLLPRDKRVVEHARAGETLAAVAGVPLDATDLRMALTGCASGASAREARQAGENWRIVPEGSGEVYLHRETPTAPWRVVAAQHSVAGGTSWRAEYRDVHEGPPAAGLPKSVRLTSVDGKRFDLRLVVSEVELNTPLEAGVFTVQIPPGTLPISLDELRQSGPLAGSNGDR